MHKCNVNVNDVVYVWCRFMFCFCSLDALVLRFEAPDSRNRWDSPLFTIQKEDTLQFEAISDAIFKRKAPPPNQSTQSVRNGSLAFSITLTLSLSVFFILNRNQIQNNRRLYIFSYSISTGSNHLCWLLTMVDVWCTWFNMASFIFNYIFILSVNYSNHCHQQTFCMNWTRSHKMYWWWGFLSKSVPDFPFKSLCSEFLSGLELLF